MDRIAKLQKMMLIRTFEVQLMAHPDHGFQLLSSGEEAVAVGICAAMNAGDQLLCSGRSIGPALARGLHPASVMAELLGKANGTNQGRGGRGHMSSPEQGFFGSHAVVGGNLTIAAGAAMAAQREGAGHVVICLFGDGACGTGALHETLNIAALWQLPLVLVCSNNGLAVSTPPAGAIAANPLSQLAVPFGIEHKTIDGMDVDSVAASASDFVDHARLGKGPAFLECLSQRFTSHSSASRDSRCDAELASARAQCPIEKLARSLEADGLIDAGAIAQLWSDAEQEVEAAMRCAEAADPPDIEAALRDV